MSVANNLFEWIRAIPTMCRIAFPCVGKTSESGA
jgi:hypothetical protein